MSKFYIAKIHVCTNNICDSCCHDYFIMMSYTGEGDAPKDVLVNRILDIVRTSRVLPVNHEHLPEWYKKKSGLAVSEAVQVIPLGDGDFYVSYEKENLSRVIVSDIHCEDDTEKRAK